MADQDKNKRPKNGSSHPLRDKAEKFALSSGLPREFESMTSQELIHELRVHQIELEMQNEELKNLQYILEVSRDKYADLYDFAPVGYFTLGFDALIMDVNLAGATLLGIERNKLIGQRFRKFVAPDHTDKWDQYIIGVCRHDGKKSCELQMIRLDGSVFFAQFDSARVELPAVGNNLSVFGVRIIITDITEKKKIEEEKQQQFNELEIFYKASVGREERIVELKNKVADLEEKLKK